MAAPAAASPGYTALTRPAVDDDGWYQLGTVRLEASSEALAPGMSVVLSLPGGFEFIDDKDNAPAVTTDTCTFTGDADGELVVSAPDTVGGKDNSLSGGNEFSVEMLDENQIKIEVNDRFAEESGDDAASL
jgi:hypothetical protein